MGFNLVFIGLKHVPTTPPVPPTMTNLLSYLSVEAEERRKFKQEKVNK
jgi:hypothetical protein